MNYQRKGYIEIKCNPLHSANFKIYKLAEKSLTNYLEMANEISRFLLKAFSN